MEDAAEGMGTGSELMIWFVGASVWSSLGRFDCSGLLSQSIFPEQDSVARG